LSNKLITINARVLPEETLYGDSHKYLSGKNANWTSNLRTLPMYIRAQIPCWVIVFPRTWRSDVENFKNTLLKVAHGLGFKLQSPTMLVLVIVIINAIYHLTQTQNMLFLIFFFLELNYGIQI